MNTDLNNIAAEALVLFRDKLSGKVIDEQRFYSCRKLLTEAAVRGDPYPIERLGDYLAHSQHLIAQVKLPLSEAAQSELLARFASWIEQRLNEAAKRASRRDARSEGQLAAAAAVVSSSSGLKKRGGK
jgi:hypothetical protein